MLGEGPLLKDIQEKVIEEGLEDYIILKGNVANTEVQDTMKESDILLFTSDKTEGWGAVVNEAMANGCIPLASHEPGSVPFLIQPSRNGFIYEYGNSDSLKEKLDEIVSNSQNLEYMKQEAVNTATNDWSAKTAVNNLLLLIDSLNNGQDIVADVGPVSKAEPYNEKEFLSSIL